MKFEADIQKLLKTGGYFGHKISRTNPKSLPYTYKAQNGIYLIDLFKTKECIELSMKALYEKGKLGEDLLVVGTKRLIKAFIKETLNETNVYYLHYKWVGGFLTNFEEIYKNIKRTNEMIADKEKGNWSSLPKHEIAIKERQLTKYLKVYEGVLKMEKRPKNILIIDIKKERNAYKEALRNELTIFAVADTNADPTQVDYPMIVNDDSASTLEYVLKLLIDSYLEGRKKMSVSKK
jgi:small subunit ribosomal protein S2